MLVGGRGRFSVFSQAVTTTPNAEAVAEAETSVETTSIPETPEDAPPATLKTKKLTKRVKHIMEVSLATGFWDIDRHEANLQDILHFWKIRNVV